MCFLSYDKLVDRHKMRLGIDELWTFVGLRKVGVEDGVSELADCLEIRRVLCNQLIENFLFKLISHNELLTQGCKVDPSTCQDGSKTEEVGRYSEISLALPINRSKCFAYWLVKVHSRDLKICSTLVNDIEAVNLCVSAQSLVWLEDPLYQLQG